LAERRQLKWLELLKEIAPDVKRVAVLRDPAISAGTGQFGSIQTAAPSLGVELTPIKVRNATEIERSVTAFVRSGNGGLIVTPSASVLAHRNLIITLAARHKLPAVYYARFYVTRTASDMTKESDLIARYEHDFKQRHWSGQATRLDLSN
jgi:putative ABC transport system substrate-binding protein